MQLAGNPSLIDPTKVDHKLDDAQSAEMIAALSDLSEEDRTLVEKQRICPVTDCPLGSMGTPPKVDLNGQPIFICCEGCRESLLDEPKKYLAKLAAKRAARDSQEPQMDLPPISTPRMVVPQFDIPQAVSNEANEPSTETLR
jgi:hypothetical protein